MSSDDRFFDDGAAYERLMGRWSRLAGEVFLDWIAVPTNLRWIDIGCGTGVFTEEIIRHCSPAEVIALEPSPGQLAFARIRPGLETAEFRLGDAEDLPFEDDRFDIAVMALVIHFLRDPVKALTEMARVVRPGGWVTSYVWDYSIGGSPTAPVVALLKSLGIKSSPPPSARFACLPAVLELWRTTGLSNIETRVISVPVTFDDFDDFWASMSAPAGPAGKALAGMAPDIMQQVRARLKESVPIGAGGRVVYEAAAVAIKANKSM